MINRGLFSSASIDWSTPKGVYQSLNKEFHFDDDPCPLDAAARALYSDDGLARPWGERVFINPPYGKAITPWLQRAYEEGQAGKLVVCLIPSRTDTRWFHDYVMKAEEIRFIKGRLKFGDAKNSAPFPSAVVIFGGGE